ncbi:hypothetical protein [Photobacterium galatheae]|uniref:Uncharacterized protein n=1 Tax=Photobacterium galatheae TaxID=1654360 RepID=A0A066RRC6_9GAMM|nr:hypothetical protein [Photobacterium galatheae]KDM89953.1 hypothetical protein EA58_19610 [Photobacterium galatheae]MCM0149252.1 hypothetical protein [Photobacterium galatheae]
MKLSEICRSDKASLHGLVLDEVPKDIPENLREVSVVAELKSGALCPEFVTKLVTWTIKCKPKGVYTIVEFKDLEPGMVSRLILVCGNLQVGISLVPPSVESEASLSQYKQVLGEATIALLKFRGSSPYLYPVCNYLEYMAANILCGVEVLEPKDIYTKKTFKDILTPGAVDEIKTSLAEVVYETLGGKDKFEESVKVFSYATYRSVEEQISGNG